MSHWIFWKYYHCYCTLGSPCCSLCCSRVVWQSWPRHQPRACWSSPKSVSGWWELSGSWKYFHHYTLSSLLCLKLSWPHLIWATGTLAVFVARSTGETWAGADVSGPFVGLSFELILKLFWWNNQTHWLVVVEAVSDLCEFWVASLVTIHSWDSSHQPSQSSWCSHNKTLLHSAESHAAIIRRSDGKLMVQTLLSLPAVTLGSTSLLKGTLSWWINGLCKLWI